MDGRIVFSGYEEGDRGLRLYAVSAKGGRSAVLLENPSWFDMQPEWLADGRRLVFASDRSGHFEVWLLDVATGALSQLTRTDVGESASPRVSPTSDRLAYLEWHSALDSLSSWFITAYTLRLARLP